MASVSGHLTTTTKKHFGKAKSRSFERVLLQRTSDHNEDILCEHCEHQHQLKCCLYLYDDDNDIMRYALFKKELDEPYWVKNQSEDFDMTIGNVTPKNFPCFSINDPEQANKAAMRNFKQPPFILIRQFLWPLFLPTNQQVPIQNIEHYKNPLGMKQLHYQRTNCYGNVHQVGCIHQYPHQYSYQPLVMKQVAIPLMVESNNYSTQPKIIESHYFYPIPIFHRHQYVQPTTGDHF